MYILIINPVAGNGRAKYFYNQFIRDVRIKNVRFKSFFTKYKGHAEEIIRNYLDKNNTFQIKGIIVFGGDGTLHDVINGFDHDLIPVALIPGGSGNDFARGIRIPKNRNHIIDNIVKKISKPYSYGHYKLPQKSVRSFLNCVGFGFDAVVANHVNHSKLKRILNKLKLGKLSYLYALLVQLFRYKPIDITIELDGVTKEFPACFFATVSNQPYFGGGMKINPKAKNNTKDFAVLVIDSISKWKVLFLFGTVFTGKHLSFKEVKTYRAKNIRIQTEENILFQVDGETGITRSCDISKSLKSIDILGVSQKKIN